MFWNKKKKLYRIKYEGLFPNPMTYVVWAQNEGQALKELHKYVGRGAVYQIFSIEEYESEKTLWT